MLSRNRFITRGINEKLDIRIQLIIWELVDSLNNDVNIEADYLQIFKVKKEKKLLKVQHEQEQPEYKNTYTINIEDIQIEDEIKIYVIDSGEYSTMMFPYEY